MSEVASAKFAEGYNCAQAVLYAACGRLKFDNDAALRMACGLGAGMGRNQEVCGAVSGGILALGLRHGRGEGGDVAATEATYAKTREFMTRFSAKHGSCFCRELLGGCSLTTEEGRQRFKAEGLKARVCTPCVETSAAILEDLLR